MDECVASRDEHQQASSVILAFVLESNGISLSHLVVTSELEHHSSLQSLLGWQGAIRVDNITYSWMGYEPVLLNHTANVTDVQITPTQSVYLMEAGPVNLTVTFLSPVEVRRAFRIISTRIYACADTLNVSRRIG